MTTFLTVSAQSIDTCFKDIECTDNTSAWDKTEWGDEIKSVCRIVTKFQRLGQNLDSTVHTGVLINNPNLDNSRINTPPRGDNTIYILAAYHSLDVQGILLNDAVENSTFYFDYYNETCGDNTTRTTPIVLEPGATNISVVASLNGSPGYPGNGSDYILLKLDIQYDPCNESNVNNLNKLFFAGFDKDTNVYYTYDKMIIDHGLPPDTPYFHSPGPYYKVTGLSHPGGDGYDYQDPLNYIGIGAPMKVHTYKGQILDWRKYTGSSYRFPDFWRLNVIDSTDVPLEYGVVTSGSSGSPLFYENGGNKYVTGLLTNSSRAIHCGSIGEATLLYYGKYSRSWLGDGSPNSSIKAEMDPAGTWSSSNLRLEGKKFDGGPLNSYTHRKYISSDYVMSISQVNYDHDCCWEIEINFPDDALCFGSITVEEGSSGVEIEQTELTGTDPVKLRYCPDTDPSTFTVRIYSIHGILLAEHTFTDLDCYFVTPYDCSCLDAVTVVATDTIGPECCFTLDGITSDPKCDFYGFQILNGSNIIYQNKGNSTTIANGVQFCVDNDKLTGGSYKLQFLDEYDGSGLAPEVLCEKLVSLPNCEVECCDAIENLRVVRTSADSDTSCCFDLKFDLTEECDITQVNITIIEDILVGGSLWSQNYTYNISPGPFITHEFCVTSDLETPQGSYNMILNFKNALGEIVCTKELNYTCEDICCPNVNVQESPPESCCFLITVDDVPEWCEIEKVHIWYDDGIYSKTLGEFDDPFNGIYLCPEDPVLQPNNIQLWFYNKYGDYVCFKEATYSCTPTGGKKAIKSDDVKAKGINISNIPNPATESTLIKFTLVEESNVNIELFEISGKSLGVVSNSILSSGEKSIDLNTSIYSPGTYILRFTVDNETFIHLFQVQ
jgi:hypothetical protein